MRGAKTKNKGKGFITLSSRLDNFESFEVCGSGSQEDHVKENSDSQVLK